MHVQSIISILLSFFLISAGGIVYLWYMKKAAIAPLWLKYITYLIIVSFIVTSALLLPGILPFIGLVIVLAGAIELARFRNKGTKILVVMIIFCCLAFPFI